MSFILENAKFVPFAIIAILVILLLACGYVKAPPDQAYIISGLGRKSRAADPTRAAGLSLR